MKYEREPLASTPKIDAIETVNAYAKKYGYAICLQCEQFFDIRYIEEGACELCWEKAAEYQNDSESMEQDKKLEQQEIKDIDGHYEEIY